MNRSYIWSQKIGYISCIVRNKEYTYSTLGVFRIHEIHKPNIAYRLSRNLSIEDISQIVAFLECNIYELYMEIL